MATRKKSSHRSILLHFHDDGQVCPESLGKPCYHGGLNHGKRPASPNFLSKLPNGFSIPGLNGLGGLPGMGGPAGSSAAGIAMAMAAAQDPEMALKLAAMGALPGMGGPAGTAGGNNIAMAMAAAQDPEMALKLAAMGALPGIGGMAGNAGGGIGGFGGPANPLAMAMAADPEMALMMAAQASVSGNGISSAFSDPTDSILFDNDTTSTSGGTGGFYSGVQDYGMVADVPPNSLAVPGSAASNLGIAAMAKSAIEAGTPSAIAAMAKMAAASGNMVAAQALNKVATMAAQNGLRHIPPSAVMQIIAKTGLGGPAALQMALQAAKEVEKTITPDKMDAAEKYKAMMVKQAADVEMKKTLANSSLAKLSDSEVKVMTEGKFATAEEFMEYMQSSDTDVSRYIYMYLQTITRCIQTADYY